MKFLRADCPVGGTGPSGAVYTSLSSLFKSKSLRLLLAWLHTSLALVVRSSVKCLPTPRCGIPMNEGCTQPLSSDPMINLSTMVLFLISSFSVVRNLHNLESLTPYTIDLKQTIRVRESRDTHKTKSQQHTHTHTSWEKSTWDNTTELQLKNMCSNLNLSKQKCGRIVSMS
jgi:ABC-type nickel/cobalt efflux system permease component RcnA